MSVEAYKELDDFFRSMRQAYNSRDMKMFRTHFWTDKRFIHVDHSGRMDLGWGAFEEVLDQEFRYMDSVKLELKELKIHVFDDQFSSVTADWKVAQVDPEGRGSEESGRVSFTICRLKDDWKIVHQHYTGALNGIE